MYALFIVAWLMATPSQAVYQFYGNAPGLPAGTAALYNEKALCESAGKARLEAVTKNAPGKAEGKYFCIPMDPFTKIVPKSPQQES